MYCKTKNKLSVKPRVKKGNVNNVKLQRHSLTNIIFMSNDKFNMIDISMPHRTTHFSIGDHQPL